MTPAFPKPGPRDKTGKRLRRTSQMARTNAGRKRWLHEIQFGGGCDFDHYARAAGCALARMKILDTSVDGLQSAAVHACAGSIQAAHLTSRGAGGKWYSVVGLCDSAHREQESGKLSDAAMAGLRSRAKQLVADHLRSIGAI